MSEWLHWIGKQYYSPAEFAREAKALGVTRRIGVRMLKAMRWGNQIYVIGKQKPGKSGHIFGTFCISRVVGMCGSVVRRLQEELRLTLTDFGGEQVDRGCGSFLQGPTYEVACPLPELAERLDEADDTSTLMVGGNFVPISPAVRMADIPFQQGFRKFDGKKFEQDILTFCAVKGIETDPIPKKTNIILYGMYYPITLSEDEEKPLGSITPLVNYHKKGVEEESNVLDHLHLVP